MIAGWGISCEIAPIWMSLDFTNDQSTLVQVMAWCRQATSYYLSRCWPRSLSPYGVTRPQWVNSVVECKFLVCIFLWVILLDPSVNGRTPSAWYLGLGLAMPYQGLPQSGKSQGNSSLSQSQRKVREFCNLLQSQGKVREFCNLLQSQGKVREFCNLLQIQGKVREFFVCGPYQCIVFIVWRMII